MNLRIPFFGLISPRSPLNGLLDHYAQITRAMDVIDDSMECYVSGGACQEFSALIKDVDRFEEEADKIKRSIRNHLPRGLMMPVDKAVFLDYTSAQDNILDAAQEALHWLGMRSFVIPEVFQKGVVYMIADATVTVKLLEPALKATIDLVHGSYQSRTQTKEAFRAVRAQHKKVSKARHKLVSEIYNSDMEFKDIHQLIHFVDRLGSMSHSAEACADRLRAMIAR